MTVSDRQGRALEYILTEILCTQLKLICNKTNFTPQATRRQLDDKHNYDALDSTLKNHYNKCSDIVIKWLIKEKIKLKAIAEILIDKQSDQAGIDSDVTDLKILLNNKNEAQNINISLKHRHLALKHPRLTRVPNWILVDDKGIVNGYKGHYLKIWNDFIFAAKKQFPDAIAFCDVKNNSEEFINDNLYAPLCSLVKGFLETNISTAGQVEHLFQFLVGKYSFLKIIVFNDRVDIVDFSDIASPSSVEIALRNKSYLWLSFDNGWVIAMRLHTASTNISSKSVKFDVQCPNLDSLLPKTTLPL